MNIEPILNLTKVALEDLSSTFEIKTNLYEQYVEKEILKNDALLHLLHLRNGNFDWVKETPLGGAGTSLNAILLYCLIREKNMNYVIETGVSGGYYTAFMIEGLYNGKGYPALTSLEISNDMNEVGKLIPEATRRKTIASCEHLEVDWNLITGKSSLEYFKKFQNHNASLYSHDSLHTMAHMIKELNEFKKSISDEFYVFIDDEKSDNFWNKCLQMGAFKKPGYQVKYISGQESRLRGHMGGFVQYKKEK